MILAILLSTFMLSSLNVFNTVVVATPLVLVNDSSASSAHPIITWIAETVISHVHVPETTTETVVVIPTTTISQSAILWPIHLLPSFSVSTTSLPVELQTSIPSVSPSSPMPIVITESSIETLTSTKIIIERPTSTTPQVSASPSVATVTETTTVFVSSPLPSATPAISTSKTTWSAPAQMTDLGSFNISTFPVGQHNLEIVNGIPANASATSLTPTATQIPPPSWDNSSSALQLFYPANSINPGNMPQGGAEFYAVPLYLAAARNATLEYSVFFPANFDWVLAGKLPGFYGGHTGCSGGNDALDCFSTRLMWRKGGSGELYLYAPKDKQTDALCSDPQSVCDTAYGLSVGRGSFTWAAGAWTTVRQTVFLNTPGKQDGGFVLEVNGKRVIERNDVFYRDVPSPADGHKEAVANPEHTKTMTASHGGGDLLGPLLGGILQRMSEDEYTEDRLARSTSTDTQKAMDVITTICPLIANNADQAQNWLGIGLASGDTNFTTMNVMATTTTGMSSTSAAATSQKNLGPLETAETIQVTPTVFPVLNPIIMQSSQREVQPVGFIGLFFSTFFGGHEEQYATPRDQYTWFKDFAMSLNS